MGLYLGRQIGEKDSEVLQKKAERKFCMTDDAFHKSQSRTKLHKHNNGILWISLVHFLIQALKTLKPRGRMIKYFN